MNQGSPATDFKGAQLVDSTANFHGNASTFNFADGHAESKKWLDAAMIQYSASMDQNKFASAPNDTQAPATQGGLPDGILQRSIPDFVVIVSPTAIPDSAA